MRVLATPRAVFVFFPLGCSPYFQGANWFSASRNYFGGFVLSAVIKYGAAIDTKKQAASRRIVRIAHRKYARLKTLVILINECNGKIDAIICATSGGARARFHFVSFGAIIFFCALSSRDARQSSSAQSRFVQRLLLFARFNVDDADVEARAHTRAFNAFASFFFLFSLPAARHTSVAAPGDARCPSPPLRSNRAAPLSLSIS